jgi:DNA-binding beta-propeller fold protein YncE
VWVIDQADTTPAGGGTLYIYQGPALTGGAAATAVPERIDLGAAAQHLCLERTGTMPRRPHMISFNHPHSHAIVSYVTSGHVLFMDASSRTPIACLDVGEEAHAAFPSPDQSHVVVANQNGKLLQRIRTGYTRNAFILEPAATLDLARCRTPSGAPCEDPVLRPDNAPVCPVIDSTGRLTFVTLRGGGLLVVDSTTTPMSILAEYDRATVHPNGCGGAEAAGKMYIRAGGGTAADPVHSDLYAFPLSRYSATAHAPNTPAPTLVFSHDHRRFVDGHGGTLTKGGRFLWVGDRFANRLIVVDTATDRVVNEIGLSGRVSSDPAPDILDVAPAGDWIFVSLRGPTPLTMNARGVDNAVGSTPGIGVIRVEPDGWRGALVGVAPIRHLVDGVERADPHGLKVRWP